MYPMTTGASVSDGGGCVLRMVAILFFIGAMVLLFSGFQLNRENEEVVSQLAIAEAEKTNMQQKITDLTNSLGQVQALNADLLHNLDQSNQEILDIKASLDEANRNIAANEQEKALLRKSLEEAQMRSLELTGQVESHKAVINELSIRLAEASTRIADLESVISQQEEMIAAMQKNPLNAYIKRFPIMTWYLSGFSGLVVAATFTTRKIVRRHQSRKGKSSAIHSEKALTIQVTDQELRQIIKQRRRS